MIPINNSDTAWLIVTDYNQDNGLFYEDLREDILNPEVNDYIHGCYAHMVGACGMSGVGTVGFSSEALHNQLIPQNGGVVGWPTDYHDNSEIAFPQSLIGDMYAAD